MRFGASRSLLYDAQKTARARWEVATETWSDDARRRHEETAVLPLDQLTTEVLRAVDQLAVLFAEVKQSIEYED